VNVPFRLVRSATIHIPNTGSARDRTKGHLFVVLTNTCSNGQNLLVPVCTDRGKADRTCLLGVGDHPFLTDPSFVMYAHLDLYDAPLLQDRIKSGVFGDEGLLDERIFARVCMGVTQSIHSAPVFKRYYDEQTQTKVARPTVDKATD
jgi:hypothetical protein